MSRIYVTIPPTFKQFCKPENAFLRSCDSEPVAGKAHNVEEYYANFLTYQYLNRIKADYYCFISDVWEKTWGNCLKNSFTELNSREFDAKKYINNYVWYNEMFHRAFRINDEKNLWIGSCTWRTPKGGVYLGLWFGEYTYTDVFCKTETLPQNWNKSEGSVNIITKIAEGYLFWYAKGGLDTAANLMKLKQIALEPLRAAAEKVLQNYR